MVRAHLKAFAFKNRKGTMQNEKEIPKTYDKNSGIETIICPNCGEQNRYSNLFCYKCGKKLQK